jgi:aspartate-semialdehyde dehydrogenase
MRAMLAFQEPPPPAVLPHRLAFNVIPQVGAVGDDGASEDEVQLAAELARLLGQPGLPVAATSLRVPVFYGHVQTVSLATLRPLGAAGAREALRQARGVKLLDTPREGVYPMPMLAVNDDAVLVGRVREDPTTEHGLSLVVVGDNLRKGAAVNAVEVARALFEGPLAG